MEQLWDTFTEVTQQQTYSGFSNIRKFDQRKFIPANFQNKRRKERMSLKVSHAK